MCLKTTAVLKFFIMLQVKEKPDFTELVSELPANSTGRSWIFIWFSIPHPLGNREGTA